MRLRDEARREEARLRDQTYVDATQPPIDSLNDTFEEHGAAGRVVAAVFPSILDELGLAGILDALRSDRWKIRQRETLPRGEVLVALEWATAAGDVSDVMGFAPFPTMPVPRRAPYVAFATWPGGRSNPFRGALPTPPARPGRVSFLDARHELERDRYDEVYAETNETVRELLGMPAEQAKLYRRAAFSISSSAAATLQFDP